MKNSFEYSVRVVPLSVKNTNRDDFRKQLLNIPYLLYEVEKISDGTSIVINKPGGKKSFGRMSKNDIQVFIYNPRTNNLWLISHNEIETDIEQKMLFDKEETLKVVKGLLKVCNGEEPTDVISSLNIKNDYCGILVETIFKSYKWIWGQEDCNYPKGEGRWLSMNYYLEKYGICKD